MDIRNRVIKKLWCIEYEIIDEMMRMKKRDTESPIESPAVFSGGGGVCCPIELGPGLLLLMGRGGVGMWERTPWWWELTGANPIASDLLVKVWITWGECIAGLWAIPRWRNDKWNMNEWCYNCIYAQISRRKVLTSKWILTTLKKFPKMSIIRRWMDTQTREVMFFCSKCHVCGHGTFKLFIKSPIYIMEYLVLFCIIYFCIKIQRHPKSFPEVSKT